ncbi:lactobin A/cerein 7B family class IIb bacteriocin [Tenacibaculum skagerrakense]|uniref:Lactobin A/cerein 7B family class IIb bacteriocin n=1 Tax=Tenacibaculum skagerrakense TaxID=186571 RepID=A0A4R2NRH6_9FLAO|nr:class IIb bacteriocin, lactobin A/cerein 7B family [Tenacibaculum skagerrakense]TCP24024.1 lactobin A/cerein 7B family class IIb bacteriocin [Tenacibaculum skagerrakense]
MKLTLEQQQKGQEIYSELVQKSWDSAEFKNELINNPEATISEVIGKEFKGNVVVCDQTDPETIYINIPRKVSTDDLELSDEQLEMVSGGDILIAAGIGFMAGVAFMGAAAAVKAIL